MTRSTSSRTPVSAGENSREARLKAALKANIARRKEQARARKGSGQEAAGADDGDAAGGGGEGHEDRGRGAASTPGKD